MIDHWAARIAIRWVFFALACLVLAALFSIIFGRWPENILATPEYWFGILSYFIATKIFR